jgi:hypothetical protein
MHVLSVEIARADGSWPFCVGDREGGVIVKVAPHGKNTIGVGYKDLRLAPDDMR